MTHFAMHRQGTGQERPLSAFPVSLVESFIARFVARLVAAPGRRLVRSRRGAWAWALAAGLGCAAAPLAFSADYLRTTGPSPLRWQPLAQPRPEVLQTLPHLAILVDDKSPALRSAASPASGPAAKPPAGSDAGTNAFSTVTGPAAPEALPSQTLPPTVLGTLFYSPNGTNGPAVVMPLNFVPPMAPTPVSSSATYSTAPQ